jgi:small-conductance mechanosensitive channel
MWWSKAYKNSKSEKRKAVNNMGETVIAGMTIPLAWSDIEALQMHWKYVLAVLFVGFIGLLTQKVLLGVARKIVGQSEAEWDDDLIDVVGTRILLTALVSAVQLVLSWLHPDVARESVVYINAIMILLAASALSATVKIVLRSVLEAFQNRKAVVVEGSNPLIIFLVRGMVWAGAVFLIADELNLDLSGILASLAVFSIIIGLAVQHTLGNIMNSFMLSLDRPFDTGDRILVDDVEGTVVSMGMLSTKLLTLEEELVIIPNNSLVNSTIRNFSRGGGDNSPKRVVLTVDVGVDYDEDSSHVKHTLIRVAEDCEHVLLEPKPVVQLTNLGDFSKDYRLYVWLSSAADRRIARDQLLSEIDVEFKAESISIPYPIAVELESKEAIASDAMKRKQAKQHAAKAKMNLIDRRLDRQRRAIREEILTLEERLEQRIPSKERKTLTDEVERLESMLASLDLD